MRRNEGLKRECKRSVELNSILDKIKGRRITVKHFFSRKDSSLERLKIKPHQLPPIQFLRNKKSKSSQNLYTSMEIHLAKILPKQNKTTVQQLMKLTTNAKALVSSENIEYHRDKVINLMKLRPLDSFMEY